MAASLILMVANGCFTNKTFGCSNVLRVYYLELADIYLQVMKSICLALPNYKLNNSLMPGGKKGHSYLSKPAMKRSRLVF